MYRDPEGRLLFKRVIGLPGEEIAILDEKVFIDGTSLAESYIDQPTLGTELSVVLSENEVFVLGDNRNKSSDSRNSGPVSLGNIVGKVVLVLSPERMYPILKVSYPATGSAP